MIKPQELRIGNMLSIEGTFIKVGKIEENSISWNIAKDTAKFKIWNPFLPVSDKKINPIPLTKEILLKFGFNKEYQKGYIGIDVCNSDFVLTEPFKMGEWQTNYTFQFETGSVPKFKEIEYVHQLQNLFFALTGEELTFKKD